MRALLDRLAGWGSPGRFTLAAWLSAAVVLGAAAVLAPDVPLRWDALWYHEGAASIARGDGYLWRTEEEYCGTREHYAFMPVGYPAFLGALYAIGGPSPAIGRVANALLCAAAVPLLYAIGRRVAAEGVARTAALLFFGLMLTTKMHRDLYSEALFTLAVLLVGWVCVSRPFRGWQALGGAALGVAHLVRPVSAALPVVLFLAMWLTGCRVRRSAAVAALLLALSLAVVLPWTARNWSRFGRFVFVSTNGGLNLWIGHNPLATGGHLDPAKGQLLLPPELASTKGELEWDREARRLAFNYIRSDPWSVFRRMPAKLSHALGFSYAARVHRGGEGTAKVAGVLAIAAVVSIFLVCALVQGAWALAQLARRGMASGLSLVPALFVLYFLAFPLLFFGVRRLIYPAYPFLALSAAILLGWAVPERRGEASG